MTTRLWKRDKVPIASWIQAQHIQRCATPAHSDSSAAIKEKWKRSWEVNCWKWIWCRTFYRLDSCAAAGLGSGCCPSCLLEVNKAFASPAHSETLNDRGMETWEIGEILPRLTNGCETTSVHITSTKRGKDTFLQYISFSLGGGKSLSKKVPYL